MPTYDQSTYSYFVGWNNSTGLPDGSSSRIWKPPGPFTISLRNVSPASQSRLLRDARHKSQGDLREPGDSEVWPQNHVRLPRSINNLCFEVIHLEVNPPPVAESGPEPAHRGPCRSALANHHASLLFGVLSVGVVLDAPPHI